LGAFFIFYEFVESILKLIKYSFNDNYKKNISLASEPLLLFSELR